MSALVEDARRRPEEILLYLPEYRVLICKGCRYALQPSGIPRHLKDLHHIYRSARRPFVQFVARLDLAEPQDVLLPTASSAFPIPYLPVEDGFRCTEEDCGHLCVTAKRMKRHWVVDHGRTGVDAVDWRPVRLQTFFRGNQLQYFSDYGDRSVDTRVRQLLSPLLQPFISEEAAVTLGEVELELLEHYVSSTYLTIADDDDMRRLTRETCPRSACEYRYFMDGLLACAALHIAHTDPSRQLEMYMLGTEYRDKAIIGYEDAVKHITDDNCYTVFTFSHLVRVFAFTTPQGNLSAERYYAIDSFPQVLHYIRGTYSVLSPMWHLIVRGPTKVLITPMEKLQKLCNGDDGLFLSQLMSILPELIASGATAHDCETYRTAAVELSRAYCCCRPNSDGLSIWDAIYLWPVQLPQDFFVLLDRKHPTALILLAYYCSLLVKVDDYWYMRGWGRGLLRGIWCALGTDVMRKHIHQPLQDAGLT